MSRRQAAAGGGRFLWEHRERASGG